MKPWLQVLGLVVTFAIMIYSRTQAHLEVMSAWWITWMIFSHMVSVGIGFALRGIKF